MPETTLTRDDDGAGLDTDGAQQTQALTVVDVAWIAHDVGLDIDLEDLAENLGDLAGLSPASLSAAQKYCQRRSQHSIGWLLASRRLEFLLARDVVDV